MINNWLKNYEGLLPKLVLQITEVNPPCTTNQVLSETWKLQMVANFILDYGR